MNDLADLQRLATNLRTGLDRVIMGQDAVKEQVLVGLLAGGHVLLEGEPGTAKTLLALTLSRLLGCRFSRIQFTPDLMPVDLLGTSVFNPADRTFTFHPGPVFTDVLLADEINRTPPRTQSALLECMQESAATIDGVRRAISDALFVIATQNPVEFEGTYPLPEAQRDRFLLKISVPFPAAADERAMLAAYAEGRHLHEIALSGLTPVIDLTGLVAARRSLSAVIRVDEKLLDYLMAIVRATREDEAVRIGAGPRATLSLLACSRAMACLRGRDFVSPDDIKHLAHGVLIHRVTLTAEAEMEGVRLEDVLTRVFARIEVPR